MITDRDKHMSEWNSVKDRLPDDEQDVMFWRNPGGFSVGFYLSELEQWQDKLDVDNDAVPEMVAAHLVTHWQPLPLPPTGTNT